MYTYVYNTRAAYSRSTNLTWPPQQVCTRFFFLPHLFYFFNIICYTARPHTANDDDDVPCDTHLVIIYTYIIYIYTYLHVNTHAHALTYKHYNTYLLILYKRASPKSYLRREGTYVSIIYNSFFKLSSSCYYRYIISYPCVRHINDTSKC